MALRRRSGPVLYDVGKPNPIYEFDYSTYYNACTLKSCSFAGLRDEVLFIFISINILFGVPL